VTIVGPILQTNKTTTHSRGFALPTILIASIVMLTVLLVSVSSTSTIRTALNSQYYEQLAHVAGDAGIAYAEACLNANGNVPQWSNASPLTPNSDCSGTLLSTGAAKVLVVAGGGGGGNNHAGGGGGGGLIYQSTFGVAVQSYPVTVGAGGAGGTATGLAGTNGGNSVFSTLTAVGGGGGGGRIASNSVSQAKVGGSGGGGAGTIDGATGLPGAGKAGTSSQGNAGGNGSSDATAGQGGGGGGAGTAGGNASGVASTGVSGTGGDGVTNSISGSGVCYAGGGSGGRWANVVNGVGLPGCGGGAGGNGGGPHTGGNGTANTGGGGGGGSDGVGNGGAGGSGVVIISYPTGTINAAGGTVTSVGGNTIHTFTSSGTFTVSAVTSYSCPTDPRCVLSTNGNIRSSFSVGLPTLDSNGKAVSIPNTGYVEILRSSNGAVWRRYEQKSAPTTAVPDLCSGEAKSIYGWNNAVITTGAYSVPEPAATPITIATGSLNPGSTYYRKDFSVGTAGTYTLTAAADGAFEVYVDGTAKLSGPGSAAATSAAVNLSVGCHAIYVRLTNGGIAPSAMYIEASLKSNSASIPLVVTDTTWRVTAGNTVHYSSANYYADPAAWTVVREYADPGWAAFPSARSISTTHSYDGSNNYPATYAFFRDQRTVTVSSPTAITATFACDDLCTMYLDGEVIANGNAALQTTTSRILQPGPHKFAIRLQNTGGVSYFYFGVKRDSDGAVLSQSDRSWTAANFWGPVQEYYSYDTSYSVNPLIANTPPVQVLVVGGGGSGGTSAGSQGGGGGGGAGGLVYDASHAIIPAAYSVVVGAGGTAVSGTSLQGLNGGDSSFDNLIAFGGGGGGSINGISAGRSGGSGGGGGYKAYAFQAGAIGIIGQGNKGGDVLSNNNGGGGGGAGGAGGNTNSTGGAAGGQGGIGGIGLANSISGVAVTYAAGGQGGTPPGGFANGAANKGNGGSGIYGSSSASGAGGSGVVIISYPTGSMTATGGTITTAGGNTIHTFTASGTFTVVSVP